MTSFELHLPVSRVSPPVGRSDGRGALASVAAQPSAPESLDLMVDGERFQAATRVDHVAFMLRDLLTASVALTEGRSARVLIPCYDTPWELCLAAGDGALLLSVYRTGATPEVRLLDQPVTLSAMIDQTRRALARVEDMVDGEFVASLRALADRLASGRATLSAPARAEAVRVRWRSRPRAQPTGSWTDSVMALAFEATVPGALLHARTENAQADLHALLVRGKVCLDVRGQRLDLGHGFPVLQVERLVSMCRPLMEAWAARRAFHLRAHVGSVTLGLRLGADERLSLSVTRGADGAVTIPGLDARSFVSPVLDGALALAAELVRADRNLARNLRLRSLRSEVRGLRRWLRDLDRLDARINPDPALYRAAVCAPAPSPSPEMDLTSVARLRYTQRWRAEIEGIDLAGTLLCGDRLVVPGARELHALDRATGASVWSMAVPRAATTLAGDGILRLSSRGEVELRSVATGEVTWTTRVAPRVGAPALAFTVTAPGLPRLVILAEGERRLVALDLRTGEARWTYTARHGGTFKMRRVGKLLIVVSGEAAVTAIDLASGELVWRFGDRVPFTTTALVHREQVTVLAGEGSRGPARLYTLDAYTGALQWVTEADAPACSTPTATGDTVALSLSTREGVVLAGFDATKGEARFRTPLGVLPGTGGARPATAAFDDLFVTNLPTGRVVAIDAQGGNVRWTQTFRAPFADDVPRRLDPQLRAGALFVPQSSLAVLRPRDGSVLAEIDACDLVPDLVRVDEQCALYVAEESGHVGCYEPGARLRVIRPVN